MIHPHSEAQKKTETLSGAKIESDRKLDTLIGNLSGIVYRCRNDKSRSMEFISGACRSITGYNPEQFYNSDGVDWASIIDTHDQENVRDTIQETLSRDKSFKISYRIKTANNETKWILEHGVGVLDDNGKISMLEGYMQNITEKVIIRQELKTGEQRYDAILEALPDLMFVINKHGIYLDAHTPYPSPLIVSKDDIIGKNIRDVFPKDLCEKIKEVFLNYDNLKKPYTLEYSLPINNELNHFEARIVQKSNGNFLTIIRDVTENKRVEIVNKENEKKLSDYAQELEKKIADRTNELTNMVQKITESNLSLEDQIEVTKEAENKALASQVLFNVIAKKFPNGAIAVVDAEYKISYLEGEELADLGVKGIDFKEVSIDEIPILSKNQKRLIKKGISRTLKGAHLSFETEFKNNTYTANATPLGLNAKGIGQALFVFNNITLQKENDVKVMHALAKEKELGELKSSFLSMASHEFRTPLSTILSSANLIERQNDPGKEDKRIRYVGSIKTSVKNLVVILNDFLSLSKLQEGKVVAQPTALDFIDFSKSVIEEIQGVTKKGQVIRFIHNQPDIDVFLDSKLLRHIVHNLLSNAIKYSEENKEITYKINGSDNRLRIEVTDEGIGIPLEDHGNMFQRFYRANNTANIQGTGLGLNIVKQYTELMSGVISFNSKLNEGSTFLVELPLHLNQR